MTDYLARAMEQDPEEREERASAVVLPGPSGIYRSAPLPAGARDGGTAAQSRAGEAASSARREVSGELKAGLRLARSGERETARQAVSSPFPDGEGRPVRTAEGEAVLAPVYGRMDRAGEVSLLSALRRAEAGADFVRRERRNLSVTLPEIPAVAGSLSAEELDRTVERDARRYGGEFELY